MDPAVARIVDANLNRTREALRVLEEHARFGLNDAPLSERCKQARHALAAVAAALPATALLSARDVAGDVGTRIGTPGESQRTSAADVARAAAKRATEGLRVIEEHLKIVNPAAATKVEQLRYEVYAIEQAVFLTAPRRKRLADARLHVLLTEALCRRPWRDVARAAIDGGADVLQLREKDLPDGERLARAGQLVEIARTAGVLVIINDRPDIARLAGADGAHVGQDDLPVAAARAVLGPAGLIGRSTHTIEQVRAALADAPDYVAVGPMYESKTKTRSQPHIAGPTLAKQAAGICELPLVAIGGITPENVGRILETGVRCVAVCQAVIGADDPAAACRKLRQALEHG